MMEPSPELFKRQDDKVAEASTILKILPHRVWLDRSEHFKLKERLDSPGSNRGTM
jgi:hypothetical protein